MYIEPIIVYIENVADLIEVDPDYLRAELFRCNDNLILLKIG